MYLLERSVNTNNVWGTKTKSVNSVRCVVSLTINRVFTCEVFVRRMAWTSCVTLCGSQLLELLELLGAWSVPSVFRIREG